MPRLSCWFIRSALLYLAAGFTLGALLLAHKGLGFSPLMWRLLPLHMEMLLVGWFLQLAMGVAFWILPRFVQGPPRGNEKLAWLAFTLLNLGIGCALTDAIFLVQGLALAGRVAELGAVILFVLGAWRRVRPFG